MKKPFLSSIWFPLLVCLALAGGATGAFALLSPEGADVTNSQLKVAGVVGGWAVGPVTGILSFVAICIVNLIRRIVRLRRVRWLDPVVVLAGIAPWFVFAWILLDEPRYTQFAIAVLDFVARPMLWGSLIAILLTVVLSIPLLLTPSRKK